MPVVLSLKKSFCKPKTNENITINITLVKYSHINFAKNCKIGMKYKKTFV